MSIKRDAIAAAYPDAVSILVQEDGTAQAWDADGNEITLSESKIDGKMDEAKSAVDLARLRTERNIKLQETDYLALSDNTISDDWKTYRQSLRDITKTYSSVDDEGFSWPTKPE
jgi:hypothetical protein|tara:strand:- start:820 stop:1161 length:342 start_codon:yes stop_codon:yes gene_type:complete